tara:strand:- start:183 stop:617 length:435 start_codon:yes stop_codon:yes gene_type:complete
MATNEEIKAWMRKILAWFLGALFLVLGAVSLPSEPYLAVATMVIGGALFPPITRAFVTLTGKTVHPLVRAAIIVAMIVLMGLLEQFGDRIGIDVHSQQNTCGHDLPQCNKTHDVMGFAWRSLGVGRFAMATPMVVQAMPTSTTA